MKYILILALATSNSFAYVYAPDTGDNDLDSLARNMQQQDIENRLDSIESKQKQQESDRWQKDLFDSVNNR